MAGFVRANRMDQNSIFGQRIYPGRRTDPPLSTLMGVSRGISALFGCLANEGRFIAFVAPENADQAIALLQRHAVTSAAAMIGRVYGGPAG